MAYTPIQFTYVHTMGRDIVKPVMVLAPGLERVQEKSLAQHLGVSRKSVKLAPPERAMEITGA